MRTTDKLIKAAELWRGVSSLISEKNLHNFSFFFFLSFERFTQYIKMSHPDDLYISAPLFFQWQFLILNVSDASDIISKAFSSNIADFFFPAFASVFAFDFTYAKYFSLIVLSSILHEARLHQSTGWIEQIKHVVQGVKLLCVHFPVNRHSHSSS